MPCSPHSITRGKYPISPARVRTSPHQIDLDTPDSTAMGVVLAYHDLCDGVLAFHSSLGQAAHDLILQ
jgi:hypothetical protein